MVALGLVLAPVVGSLPSTTASAAGPVTVLSTTFEDGTTTPWTPSGEPTLAVVDAAPGKALSITGRVKDWDTIQSPAGLLTAGTPYTLSLRARLAPGTTGTSQVHFTVDDGKYTWVAATNVTAADWTTVTDTYTLPATADPAKVRISIEATAIGGVLPGFLVDDITITGPASDGGSGGGPGGGAWTPDLDGFVPGGAVDPVTTPVSAARGTGDVAALTFDDGPNPGETAALLDYLAEKDLTATFCVIGQNVQADGGAALLRRIVDEGHTLCNHSTGYADMDTMTQAQVEIDLKANLAIIRSALGDPAAAVPYFRAPSGKWGQTAAVAVALGMQPLAVTNTIDDWEPLTEAQLTTNLRAAMKPGQVVLVHDGGGDRTASVAAVRTVVDERLAAGWTFTLPQGGAAAGGGAPSTPATGLSNDFEDTLGLWSARGSGAATAALTSTESASGERSALVTGRTAEWNGLVAPATSLTSGTTYAVSAKVKLPAGTSGSADVRLTVQRDVPDGTSDKYVTATTVTGVTAAEWTTLTINYTIPAAPALVYFETVGGTLPFLVDDVSIELFDANIQDLTPIKSTTDFPVGVAIDSRETAGAPSELLLKHFDQVTGENHMKPEAWYAQDGGAGTFAIHPEAKKLMDFAAKNDLRVYGHVLVWHSQTPAWFFQDAAGKPLTSSAADQAILRERMRTHIFSVAEALSTGGGYGGFGSTTNPLVAFDVVNEVISDGTENADGMRSSEWYRILGEEFVDLAFQYADEAFNGEFAAAGAVHPVTLFINDYNTEQSGKQQRYLDLVERLLERDVPIDGVGHQFHVSLAMPVSALRGALDRFAGLPVTQVVTELDVTTGTPVTDARLVDQGYYYRDAFRELRDFAAEHELFSVSVWGLTDGRSWRNSNGAPLLFGDDLQAKPAFFGVVDAALPPAQRAAFVFGGDVPLTDEAPSALAWWQLPLHEVSSTVGFQLRWVADHLTAFVAVEDPTVDASDRVVLQYGTETVTFGRDGVGDVEGVVEEVDGGYAVVVHLPLATPGTEGATLPFDVRVTQGGTEAGWSTPGTLGTLTLVEPLSYTEVVQASAPPTLDGTADDVWADASSVSTGKQLSGTGDATADVRTLWDGQTLYVLAEVTDDVLDASGNDPWVQDSLEIFLDPGNVKNDAYRYDDTQIRISFENRVSFGTGDEAFQRARVRSATRVTDDGYVVEAAIDLLSEYAGAFTFQGLDFQVNDAEAGARTSIRTWADPSGLGYQSPERWGVAQLVEAVSPVDPVDPTGPTDPSGPANPDNGGPGTPPAPPTGAGAAAGARGTTASGAGRLATTGAQVAGVLAVAAAMIGGGTYLVRRRRGALG